MAPITQILVVEDFVEWQVRIQTILRDHFGARTNIFVSATVEGADKEISRQKNRLDLILMDSSLGSGVFTFKFTKKIREVYSYSGPIIAMSTEPTYRKRMRDFGSSHACDKTWLVDYLKEHFPLE